MVRFMMTPLMNTLAPCGAQWWWLA